METHFHFNQSAAPAQAGRGTRLSRMARVPLLAGAIVVLAALGCTTTQKGAAIGGGTGAVAGAVIGHQSGHRNEGAAIGAGVGALSGALVGEQLDTRFCPTCGATYTKGVQYCKKDGTPTRYRN